jgi:hypothetical protein
LKGHRKTVKGYNFEYLYSDKELVEYN